MDIDLNSATLTGVQRRRKSPFENRKKCSDFGKKGLDYDDLRVKFSIQNVVFKVSRILKFVRYVRYLKPGTYSKPPQRFKMEFLQK